MQTIERVWSYLNVPICKPSPTARVHITKYKFSQINSLVFASGYINTGGHAIFYFFKPDLSHGYTHRFVSPICFATVL